MDLERWWPDLLSDQPQIRERLVTAYDDPARGYHDLRHLREVLEHLDDLVPADHPERDAVVLAAWFHDAVYDAVGDNEERSARLADAVLTQAGVPIPLVEEVTRLVRLTAGHDPAADDLPGQLLCDADLAILAAGPGTLRRLRRRRAAGVRRGARRRLPGRAQGGAGGPARPRHVVPLRRCPRAVGGEGPRQRQRGGGGAFLTRRPAFTSRVTSSRLDTGVAPASTTLSYHSDGTS